MDTGGIPSSSLVFKDTFADPAELGRERVPSVIQKSVSFIVLVGIPMYKAINSIFGCETGCLSGQSIEAIHCITPPLCSAPCMCRYFGYDLRVCTCTTYVHDRYGIPRNVLV